MNTMRKPTKPKIQLYKDRKYMLVKYDRQNYAILSTARYRKTKKEDKSVLGYYPTLQTGLEELIRLRAEEQILEKVRESNVFNSLDTLVMKYTKSVLTVISQVISQVQQHQEKLVLSS